MIKIIGGKYKNITIPQVKNAHYRPSTAKIKEAIFSIITSGEFSNQDIFHNAYVLDLFSGSGALSFEVLSRGAKLVTLVDYEKQYLINAKKFAASLGESNNIQTLNLNIEHLPLSELKYNLIFIDPPYHLNLISHTLLQLTQKKWLADNAILVIESAKNDTFWGRNKSANHYMEKDFIIVKEKVYGDSKLIILRYKPLIDKI